jgi:hypothetical protein
MNQNANPFGSHKKHLSPGLLPLLHLDPLPANSEGVAFEGNGGRAHRPSARGGLTPQGEQQRPEQTPQNQPLRQRAAPSPACQRRKNPHRRCPACQIERRRRPHPGSAGHRFNKFLTFVAHEKGNFQLCWGANPDPDQRGRLVMLLATAWLASVAVVLELAHRARALDGMD